MSDSCRAIAIVLALTAGLAACGGSHHTARTTTSTTTSTSTSSSTTTSSTATTASPSTSVTAHVTTTTGTVAPTTVTLTEADDGHAVAVHRGDLVVVVLHSTYWQFTTAANPVVGLEGSPTVEPMLQGCVPGGGCGTVTARYRAHAAGTVTLTAHRDSCGEALRCTGTQGDWSAPLTVR